MDTITLLRSSNSFSNEVEGLEFTTGNPGINPQRYSKLLLSLLVFGAFFLFPSIQGSLFAQSTTCIPGMVENGNGDDWSEECYLNNTCGLQGSPCNSNDVKILSVYLADAMGNPVPPCIIGDPQTVLVWGVFNNTTGTSRYGIRTRTEAWLNGVFDSEFNDCSFDVLVSGQTAVALLGAIDMTCGDELQLLNTWIAWNTSASQCQNPLGANYVDQCNDYSPSKCFKDLTFIDFLTPTFTFACQSQSPTMTNVCFTSSVFGGTPPYTYAWDFGDTGMSTAQNPCHSFSNAMSIYVVTLTVTDSIGQSFAVSDTVDLDVLPCANVFMVTPTCVPPTSPVACPDTLIFPVPMVTTDCTISSEVTITFSDVTTPGACPGDYSVTRTWTATDECGASGSCSVTGVVEDVLPPILTCATQTTPLNCPATPSFVPPTVTDACDGTVAVTFSDVTTPGACVGAFSVTRTWTATDDCTNTATCSSTIVVQDNTPPTITCVAQTTPLNCPATPTFNPPTVSDGCDGTVTLTFSDVTTPGACTGAFTVTRTWIATDDCLNTATCSSIIVVQDNTPPTITCVAQTTPISCPATPAFNPPTATDACDGTVSITFSNVTTPGSCPGNFSVTRTWIATDDCANTATCSATIVVQDNTPPTITCATQVTPIDCLSAPVFTPPTATDACDGTVAVTFSDVTTPGVCPEIASVTRTWTATDDCLNTATCSATIVMLDNQGPVISCPGNVTIDCEESTLVADLGNATATDVCDPSVTIQHFDFFGTPPTTSPEMRWAFLPPGTVNGSCTSGSNCATGVICFGLEYTPGVTGTLTSYTTGFFLDCFMGNSPILSNASCVMTDNSGEIDDCGGSGLVLMNSSGNTGGMAITQNVPVFIHQICLQLGSGATILIDEDEGTDLTTSVNLPGGGTATETPSFTNYTANFDILCNETCVYPSNIYRLFVATDDCGNQSTCIQQISIQDVTAPTITCATQTTPIACPATPSFVAPTATDACDGTVSLTFSDVTTPGACLQAYSVTRTWTATDDCLNSATCSSTIVVQDVTAPTITCATQTTPIACPATPSFVAPTATDACDGTVSLTFSDVTTPGACPQAYSVTRTWTATDDCLNSATCSSTIVVQDLTAPTITCATQTSPITCPAAPSFVAPTATDACDGTVSLTFSDATTPGNCPGNFSVTRTWTATDDCLNTATCSSTIVVQDLTAPTITCATQTTPIACTATPTFVAPTATDACDMTVALTFSDVTTPGNCPGNFSVTRTWTATDDCLNTATCSSTIAVQDLTAPTITCATQTTPIACPATPAFVAPTATDACDMTVALTFTDVTTPGSCPGNYSVTRTWTATDDCLNSATCSSTIVVQDLTAPTITCATQTTPIACPATPAFVAPTATDACDGTVALTFSDVTTPGACPQAYSVTRTWTATDDCLNSATCSSTIVVQDLTAPTITCATQTTPIACPAAPAFIAPTATDACDMTVALTFTDVTTPGACPQAYSVTRTWTATDDCLNSATCSSTIVVQDLTAPTITCATQTSPIACPAAPAFVAPTATDACDATVALTFTDVTTPGACPQAYSVTRTWTASDDCLNTATCSSTIVVQDLTAPTITCALQTTPITCPATPTFNPPTATDACDGTVALTFTDVTTPGSCPGNYSVTRTWTATDDCLNTATCSAIISVQDITSPTITCATQTTPIACPATPAFVAPTATDACDGTVSLTFTDVTTPGACPQAYSVTRTWTATDDCQNSATCSSTIVVQDLTAPTITCATQTTPIACPATPAFIAPTATDACDPTVALTFTDVTTPGNCPGNFSVTRTWTATDDCLNTATCSSTIVVQDLTAPTITCATQTSPIACPATPTFVAPTATDACDPTVALTFTDVTTPGNCPGNFSVTRTWTATDDCLNTATCSSTIVVQDLTAPTITCATQTTPIACPAAPAFVAPTATDACDGTVALTFSDVTTPGACPQAYSVTRTWTATDDCLNTATCSSTIVVQDLTAPTITCALQTTPITCPATPTFNPPTATDACDPTVALTFSDVTTPGTCPGNYSVTRTWTATDDCLNTATCSAIISVQDITPPTVTCATQTTPIACPATPTFVAPTATDACDPTVALTFTDVTTPGACPQAYSVTRTWTATDDCLNSATCSSTIVVQDLTAPTITCATQTTPIACPATPAFVAPTATDACDPTVALTFSDLTTPGNCPGNYSVRRTWTATDDCLNTATCSATIVVQDLTAPTITCATQTTPIACPATPTFVAPTATDACDPTVALTFTDATTPGNCPGNFSVTRTWTATDDCLNTATCSSTIVVQDLIPPTITCATQTTPIACPATPTFVAPTATDACDGTVALTFSDLTTPGNCPGNYSVRRTWTATDDCLNTATCSSTIVVQDLTAPTITCALQTTPITCPATPTFNPPTATDACDPTVALTFSDVTTPGTCPGNYSVTRTWTATDDCLNTATCSAIISVQDITPPTITCATQTTPIACPATPTFVAPTATDACDPTVALTFTDVTTPGACPQAYSVTRTWTATDDCLNSATCSSTIVVQDITAPTITCATQSTPIACPATPTFVAPTATDACDPTVALTFTDATTPGNCPGNFSVTRTWTATDDCLNTATCSSTIVVQDITPPTITCATQTTPIACPATPTFVAPTATDACDPTVALTFTDATTPGSCPGNFSVTRTWTATDDCLNTATCSSTIVVQDITAPTITCATQTSPIACPATPTFVAPTATDACDPTVALTFTDVTTPGACPQAYSVTRTWTATDDCLNTATCSSTIVVQDITPPTITCATQTSPIACPATPTFVAPTATDACDPTVALTFTDATTPGSCPGNFSVTRTWTATDDCLNTATCSSTIVVQDITPPTITCATQTTPIACPATPTFVAPTATDACDPTVALTFSDLTTPGNCPGNYSVRRTWTATDDCLNTATCSSTIVVQDITAPTITCATQTSPIACPATPTFVAPTATDACDPTVALTFTDVTTPGACPQAYSVTRTWTATDDCLNTATCSSTIVVQDITPPTITCATQTTPIACPATPTFVAPTATDACDPTVALTFTDATTPGNCPGNFSVTRTWTATDDCLNTATCSSTIVVQDITPPTITCATQTTPIACPATPTFVAPTATDACDPTVALTFTDATTPGNCPGNFSVTRTWTATDDCLNTATCSSIIVVQDITPPTITCATQTTPIACPATPTFVAPTATDACDPTVALTFTDATTPGSCPGNFSVTRTWTATDDCLNTATCSSTIVVQDITPPTITCATQTTPITCPATPTFVAPTATDACDPTVALTFSDLTTPGNCPGNYSVRRTWTATDDCLNTATCSSTIVVQDITPPTITCATQTTPITCPATPTFVAPTATDACDPTVALTFSDATTPGNCPGNFSVTRTWTATDDCLNTATCSSTIVVQDITPPTITCATQTSPIACPATPTFVAPTATDACDPTVALTFSDVTTPGACPQAYSVTRTWTATDDCLNTATCSSTIVVQDITPPTITCATQTTPIACPATPTFVAPTATDACDPTVALTFTDLTTPGNCPGNFSVTRTWTATDDCLNTATCSSTIVVQDITPPTITCATQTTPIACPATPTFVAPTATDTCDPTVALTFSDVTTPGACPQAYSVTRTWTATDDCLNTATCSSTIVVQDITPPTITCATQTSPIACPATPTFVAPTATDACDPTVALTFSDVTTPGACPQAYSVTRTWTATDDCLNTATCSSTIVVQDITPPTITCATQTTPIACPATPTFVAPTATDACDPTVALTFTDLTTPGNCPGNFSVTRTWTATDDCLNTATCSSTIVVQDITPPTITCATQTTPITCPATPTFVAPTATDACDPTVALTFSDLTTPGNCPGNYSVRRTWTATDDCLNTATCSSTIVVQDITPPTITCATQTTPIACPATPTFVAPTSTDACDPTVTLTFSDLTTPGNCPGNYSVTRTWTATDDCLNTATCSSTIVVQDITAPTITCATQTSPIACPATPTFVAPTATDACDPTVTLTFTDVTTPGACPQAYSVTRTWTATDDCLNTATCSSTIVVQDITPPTITCPPPVTVTCASAQPPSSITGITASDACDPAPVVTFVSDVTVNQTCFNRYMVNRTYRATDACGNSATCIQVITVFDNIPPTITCPAAITVQCAALVPVPNIATVSSSDNCSGPAPVITFVSDVTTNQTCVNRYTLTRTYRSTDACGNSATCAQVITVFDNTPPTITCPANLTVQCASLVPVPSPATVVTSDNCAGTPPVVTFVSDVTTNQTCINRYTLTRTYRSTDACGNSATCTQVITVFDNTPPTITPTNPILVGVPNNGTVEVQCFGQDPNWNLPTFGPADVTATDNCTGTVVLTFDDVLIDEGNCPVDGYINRYRLRWMATDACGNSASYTVFLNLIDTIPPVIVGVPEDITVSCDSVPDPPIMLTALDECLCACVVEMEQDGPNPGCQDGQIITRTWEATDYCGNVTIEQQHITLVDNEGPVMTIEEPSELAGIPNGTVLEFTCNEGGIPAYFDELNVESVSSPEVCGGVPTITFDQNLINSINCERFGYITERTFTWTGVDACGNVNTMTITAHLIDTEDPTIVGVPDMTCIGDPALELVEAVDNCEKAGLIHWDIEIPSPCGDGTALFRTYEAQDQCGNFARDTVTLIPNDGVPPTIEFINPDLNGLGQGEYISVECDASGDYYTPWGPDDVTFSDDCPGATLVFEQTIMQVYDGCEDGALLWLQLTWTATDLCGNSDSLFLYVYVKDETPPVFDAFPTELTIGCNDEWPIITATDNCNQVVITSVDNIIATDCIYEYDVVRTITATDLCGNTVTRTQTLHVGDHSGPDITGVDTLVCRDLTLPNVTAWDECAGQFVPVTLTEVDLVSDCGGKVIERTWSATDICGNVATVTQRIILDDTIPPIILVPTWSIIRKFQDNDHNFIRLSDRDVIRQLNDLDESSVFSFDLCDGEIVPVFTVDITFSQNCLTDGWWQHRVYTWVSTDVCGNSTVLTFEVDILDDVAPGFFSVPGNTEVICGDLPDPPTVFANDDSGDILAEFFQTIMEIPGQPGHFRVIRTWTAVDPCGNRSVATQSILWIPDTFVECEIILPPVVDCNSHGVIITSDVGGGIPPFTYVWDVIGQECFIQTGQGTPTITIYVGFFDVTISLTVTDAFGCQSVCTAVLECFDALDEFAGNPPTGQIQENSNDPNNIVHGSNEDYLRELNYWPNPANTMFNISFDAAVERDVEINFINFLGEVVLTDQLKAHVGANTRKIDVTKLPEGTYLFQVKTDKEIHAKGIVIMR